MRSVRLFPKKIPPPGTFVPRGGTFVPADGNFLGKKFPAHWDRGFGLFSVVSLIDEGVVLRRGVILVFAIDGTGTCLGVGEEGVAVGQRVIVLCQQIGTGEEQPADVAG